MHRIRSRKLARRLMRRVRESVRRRRNTTTRWGHARGSTARDCGLQRQRAMARVAGGLLMRGSQVMLRSLRFSITRPPRGCLQTLGATSRLIDFLFVDWSSPHRVAGYRRRRVTVHGWWCHLRVLRRRLSSRLVVGVWKMIPRCGRSWKRRFAQESVRPKGRVHPRISPSKTDLRSRLSFFGWIARRASGRMA